MTAVTATLVGGPTLVFTYAGLTVITDPTFSEPGVTIGGGEGAKLRLDGADLADLHAVINVEDDGRIHVLDLGGDAGLTVKGERVANAVLASGDSFAIGDLEFALQIGGAPASDDPTDERPTAVDALPTTPPAPRAEAPAMAHDEDPHHAPEHDAFDAVSFVLRAPEVKADKDNVNARQALAEALLAVDAYGEASVHLQALSAAEPSSPQIWAALGRSYEGIAREAFAKLQQLDPDSPYVWLLAADVLTVEEKYPQAFSLVKKAQEALPTLPGVHHTLARVYEASGHADWAAVEQKLLPASTELPVSLTDATAVFS